MIVVLVVTLGLARRMMVVTVVVVIVRVAVTATIAIVVVVSVLRADRGTRGAAKRTANDRTAGPAHVRADAGTRRTAYRTANDRAVVRRERHRGKHQSSNKNELTHDHLRIRDGSTMGEFTEATLNLVGNC
nr:hypothetical protein [Panacagrimonas sp.]